MTRAARVLGYASLAAMAGIVWLGVAAHRHDGFLWGMGLLAIAGWAVVGWVVVQVWEAEAP